MVDQLHRQPRTLGQFDRLDDQHSAHRVGVVDGQVDQRGPAGRQQRNIGHRGRRLALAARVEDVEANLPGGLGLVVADGVADVLGACLLTGQLDRSGSVVCRRVHSRRRLDTHQSQVIAIGVGVVGQRQHRDRLPDDGRHVVGVCQRGQVPVALTHIELDLVGRGLASVGHRHRDGTNTGVCGAEIADGDRTVWARFHRSVIGRAGR